MIKKRIALVLSICIACAAFAGCGTKEAEKNVSSVVSEAGSETKDAKIVVNTTDILIAHEVYETATGEGWTEYMGIYYGNDTDKVTALTVETKFDKSAGYTIDDFDEDTVEEVYPGFGKLKFAEQKIVEDDESVSVVMIFKNLDEYKNAKELVDKGFITFYNTRDLSKTKYFVAEEFRNYLTDNGAKKVDLLAAADLYLYKQ